MRRFVLAAGLAVVGGAGCAGGASGIQNPLVFNAREPDLYAGDSQSAPAMRTLPELDVPHEALSDEMRRAWLLCEEALAVPPPAPPATERIASVQEWSRTVLKAWIGKKNELVVAARESLNQAAEVDMRGRIVSGALLGLIYEDFSRVLIDVPTPTELQSEPEVAEAYADVVRAQAKPYLTQADASYAACKANARNERSLKHWGRYCERRAEVLPGKKIEAVEGTVVTVEHD